MGYDRSLSFIFRCPTKIVFGEGVAGDVGSEVDVLGGKRVMVVTDKHLVATLYNLDACPEIYAAVARALGVDTRRMSDEDAGKKAADAIWGLTKKAGLPQKLRELTLPSTKVQGFSDDRATPVPVESGSGGGCRSRYYRDFSLILVVSGESLSSLDLPTTFYVAQGCGNNHIRCQCTIEKIAYGEQKVKRPFIPMVKTRGFLARRYL